MLKTNLEWIKKNVPGDLKIWKEMISEIDWKDFGKKQANKLRMDKERIQSEVRDFIALSPAEKWDRFINGERQLGRLYQKGSIAFTRREWKGVESTARDFQNWLILWADMIKMVMRDPMSIALGLFEYRWFSSYLASVAFFDRNTLGYRGRAVTMNRLLLADVYRYVENVISTLLMADRRIGGNDKINDKLMLFDEMTMAQMMAGFPGLIGIPYQLIPMFLVSELDQLICIPYIDAVESYGLPSDTCPVPTSECGCAILDALPHCGLGFISTSTPCDGSDMATSYQDRRFKLPTFPLTLPVRYDDEDTVECGAQDMLHCIKWVEEITGEKWDWEHYFTVIRRFNEQTKMEMEKWEMNSTPYPQLIGPCYELFRKWNYEMDGGIDPRILKTSEKVNKILMKAYENREEPYPGKMKYRAIVWSCPAHYYANFSNWAANCWGINVLVEMESLNFTKHLETEDKEEALRDLARLYERMVMRRHTNGGYQNVVDELWRQCEDWNAKLIIMYQNVACKNMATVQGILDEQGRQRGYDLIWVEHDLMDPRTVSRRTMRDKVSEYMRTVMKAEPVDPSLVEFEDEVCM